MKRHFLSYYCIIDQVSLALLDETADELSGDFVMHRLPPPDINLNNQLDTTDQYDKNLNGNSNYNQTIKNSNNNQRKNNNDTKLKPSSMIKLADPRCMFCMVRENF